MAVVYAGPMERSVAQAWLEGPHAVRPAAVEADECFHCGKPVSGLSVECAGHPGRVLLHPGCVLALSLGLFHDLAELRSRLPGPLTVPGV
jgi:hypothetical protein